MTNGEQDRYTVPMHSPLPPEDIAAAKRRCRAAAMEARARAQALAGAAAGRELAAIGLDFLGLAPAVVSGFTPFGAEIEVVPLMARLAGEGWRTALPVVAGRDLPLVFRAWVPGEPTAAGAWSIPVPLDTAPVVVPDVLLVPMLAFDGQGYRLGYGGGFYDRTLAELRARKPVVAVGVAFSGQEVAHVPREAHDEPLDWILTETGPKHPAEPSGRSCG
jgi:5-formyltetrahydrofolate cyclo-ligase